MITVPTFPPEPVGIETHVERYDVSLLANPFRYVEDTETLTELRLFAYYALTMSV